MAKRKASDIFSCDICEKNFNYKSKYLRHLSSATHLRFAETLSIGDVDSDIPSNSTYTCGDSPINSCSSNTVCVTEELNSKDSDCEEGMYHDDNLSLVGITVIAS